MRSDPIFFTPPLTNIAFVIVDRPLTVYEPGFSASPNTNTRMLAGSYESVATTAKERWDEDLAYRPPNLAAYLDRNGPLTAVAVASDKPNVRA